MRIRSSVWAALLLLLACATAGFAAQARAAELLEIEADITVEGLVVVMDDGVFLDDGARLFLLIDMEDPRYEGMTVEVYGQYLLVDEMPAIKVQEIIVLDEGPREGGQDAPVGTSDSNG